MNAQKAVALDAQQFYAVAKTCVKISLLFVGSDKFDSYRCFLNKRWEKVKSIPGLQKVHHALSTGRNDIKFSCVAKMPTKLHRFAETRAAHTTEDDVLNDIL